MIGWGKGQLDLFTSLGHFLSTIPHHFSRTLFRRTEKRYQHSVRNHRSGNTRRLVEKWRKHAESPFPRCFTTRGDSEMVNLISFFTGERKISVLRADFLGFEMIWAFFHLTSILSLTICSDKKINTLTTFSEKCPTDSFLRFQVDNLLEKNHWYGTGWFVKYMKFLTR